MIRLGIGIGTLYMHIPKLKAGALTLEEEEERDYS